MARIGDSIQGGRSFGPVVERDGCTVIPVAYVFGGGGGGGGGPAGGGWPGRPLPAVDEPPSEKPPPPRTPGEGGGFGVVSWPIGAYVIKNGEVRFRPVFDVGGLSLLAVGIIRLLINRLTPKR